jgi:hydroxymethylglutaryl-CoA reductase
MAQIAHKFLRVRNAGELAQVIVTVGLAQNLGALKALVTHGIQKGHMALHARSVAMTAGASGDQIDRIAEQLVESNEIKVSKARELLALLR